LQADRRYKIVQGTGKAEVWVPSARTVHLNPSVLEAPPPTDLARIVLSARAPMPALNYTDSEGKKGAVSDSVGTPLLVNLWASWCLPCQRELADFTAHAEELRASGLLVLALNVEALGDHASAGPDAACKMLEKLKFPFSFGVASAEMVDKLEIV